MKLTRREQQQWTSLFACTEEEAERVRSELGMRPPRLPRPQAKNKKPEPKEQSILNAVLGLLWHHPAVAFVYRQNVGMAEYDGRPVRFGFNGQPDICGAMKGGRALYIEVKRPGKKMTEAQELFIEKARDAGCLAAMVTSVDEALKIIENG